MTTRSRALLGGTFLLLLTVGGLLLWRGHLPRETMRPEAGGELVASIRSEPRTFNRLVARDTTSLLISALTEAKLLRINRETDDLEPWLAERWTQSEDGRAYTLRLRENVFFSDGAPFTSADVLFSFAAAYDERVGSPIGDSLRVGGKPLQVSAPDARTVVIGFPAPFAPGLRVLDNLPVVPRHRLEGTLRAGTLRQAWGPTTPPEELAGLGPFVLKEYIPGQRLVFERNRRYWRRDEAGAALPRLDGLTLDVVPDQNAEMLRLETGQIDFTSSEIRPDDYPALKRAAEGGRLRLFDLGVSIDVDFLWFNLRPGAARGGFGWLQSTDLRRAISHAVDREAFANTVYLGLAVSVYGPVTPGNRRWYSPEGPKYPYDPARAGTLLDALGLRDRDGDGMREDTGGRPARFTLLTQKGHTARERAAAVLQEDLRRVGITVDVVPLEFGALVDRITRGDYEAAYLGVRATDTDPAINLEFWFSWGSFHFWNPAQSRPVTDWEWRIDELMKQQIAAGDIQERKRLFGDVQRIFGEQLPVICFAAPRVIIATSTRVANVRPSLMFPQILWNADALAARSTALN